MAVVFVGGDEDNASILQGLPDVAERSIVRLVPTGFERLLDAWTTLLDEAAARVPLMQSESLGTGGFDALREAERAILAYEERTRALQERILQLAAEHPDETRILARLLKRFGERNAWRTEMLPPHVLRRLIECVAAEPLVSP